MGIIRARRKAETRSLLIDAGLRVFAERGIELGSLDEVAQTAGFTKGAIYRQFDAAATALLEAADPVPGGADPVRVVRHSRPLRAAGARARSGRTGTAAAPGTGVPGGEARRGVRRARRHGGDEGDDCG